MVGQYKEPLGGHPTLLSILPIHKIEPTPVSYTHLDVYKRQSMWCFDPAYETGPIGAEPKDGAREAREAKFIRFCDRYRRRAALHDLPRAGAKPFF